jgi:putative oxidoreductase
LLKELRMTTAPAAMHHDPQSAQLAVTLYEAEQRQLHHQQQRRSAQLYAIGRMLVSTLFITSALAKLVDYDATLAALDGVVAAPALLLPLAIAVELIGGALLFAGIQVRRVGAGLIAWLVAVTLFVHYDLSNPLNRSFALANLAFAGALLMVVAHGAGALSFERILLRRKG